MLSLSHFWPDFNKLSENAEVIYKMLLNYFQSRFFDFLLPMMKLLIKPTKRSEIQRGCQSLPEVQTKEKHTQKSNKDILERESMNTENTLRPQIISTQL